MHHQGWKSATGPRDTRLPKASRLPKAKRLPRSAASAMASEQARLFLRGRLLVQALDVFRHAPPAPSSVPLMSC